VPRAKENPMEPPQDMGWNFSTMAPVTGMACPHTHGESVQIQIYPYVPRWCVLYAYLYLVVTVDCTSRSGHELYHYQLTRNVLYNSVSGLSSSNYSNGMPGLATDYQLPMIQLCTQKCPFNVRIGQINSSFRSRNCWYFQIWSLHFVVLLSLRNSLSHL